MQRFLVGEGVCSACGQTLEMDIVKGQSVGSGVASKIKTDEEIEGYGSGYISFIFKVEPCKRCIDTITEPARKLAEAVKQLT